VRTVLTRETGLSVSRPGAGCTAGRAQGVRARRCRIASCTSRRPRSRRRSSSPVPGGRSALLRAAPPGRAGGLRLQGQIYSTLHVTLSHAHVSRAAGGCPARTGSGPGACHSQARWKGRIVPGRVVPRPASAGALAAAGALAGRRGRRVNGAVWWRWGYCSGSMVLKRAAADDGPCPPRPRPAGAGPRRRRGGGLPCAGGDDRRGRRGAVRGDGPRGPRPGPGPVPPGGVRAAHPPGERAAPGAVPAAGRPPRRPRALPASEAAPGLCWTARPRGLPLRAPRGGPGRRGLNVHARAAARGRRRRVRLSAPPARRGATRTRRCGAEHRAVCPPGREGQAHAQGLGRAGPLEGPGAPEGAGPPAAPRDGVLRGRAPLGRRPPRPPGRGPRRPARLRPRDAPRARPPPALLGALMDGGRGARQARPSGRVAGR
ncbi:Phosphoglucomutase / Phosphomannomutase, partial [Giardia duodenalis]